MFVFEATLVIVRVVDYAIWDGKANECLLRRIYREFERRAIRTIPLALRFEENADGNRHFGMGYWSGRGID